MAGSQISTSVTIINSLLGFQAMSIDTSATGLTVFAGSKVEVAGAFFTFSTDSFIYGSAFSAITSGGTAYLSLTPSGTAGNQILTLGASADTPVWSNSKQGYYLSTGSNIRLIAEVIAGAGGGILSNENLLDSNYFPRNHGCEVFTSSGTFYVPAGVTKLYISGCAAGGNGGVNAAGGGGGGGGEWALKKLIRANGLGQSFVVTIGGVGADTSFGALTLNYGKNGSGAFGGAGGVLNKGTGAGGDGAEAERPGAAGLSAGSGGFINGGGGGGSYGGGNGGYGGGGNGSKTTGGSGGPAIIIVEW